MDKSGWDFGDLVFLNCYFRRPLPAPPARLEALLRRALVSHDKISGHAHGFLSHINWQVVVSVAQVADEGFLAQLTRSPAHNPPRSWPPARRPRDAGVSRRGSAEGQIAPWLIPQEIGRAHV